MIGITRTPGGPVFRGGPLGRNHPFRKGGEIYESDEEQVFAAQISGDELQLKYSRRGLLRILQAKKVRGQTYLEMLEDFIQRGGERAILKPEVYTVWKNLEKACTDTSKEVLARHIVEILTS